MWARLKQTYGGSSGNTGITGTFLSNQRSSGLSRVGWAFDAFPLFLSFWAWPQTQRKGGPMNQEYWRDRRDRAAEYVNLTLNSRPQTLRTEDINNQTSPRLDTEWVAYTWDWAKLSLQRLWKLHWQWNHSLQKDGKNLCSKPKWVNCLLKQNCQHSFLYWNKNKTPNAEMTNTLGLSDKDVKAVL